MIMKTASRTIVAAAAMAAASSLPLPAHALFGDDEARKAIIELRGRFETQQRDTAAQLEDKANKKSVLDLAAQNEQLRQEIAKLRGQIEVLTNELASAQQRQKDFYVDLDNRLRKMEPQRVNVDGREVSVDPAELKSYEAAVALFKGGDYKSAGAALFDFLRRFPQSSYAPNAQYLLGNSYYAQQDCRNAITAQQAVVKNYPDNARAPDALLNIATCQVELKNRAGARKTLESLIEQYPESGAATTAKERLQALK